jgi:hypothetical protein
MSGKSTVEHDMAYLFVKCCVSLGIHFARGTLRVCEWMSMDHPTWRESQKELQNTMKRKRLAFLIL